MKNAQRITALMLVVMMLIALPVFVRTDVGAADALALTDATVIEANKISIGFTAAKVGNAGATAYICIVDSTGAVVRSKTENNALQWNADMNYVTWPKTPMVSKVTNSVTVDGKVVNTAEGVLALTEGEYNAYTAVFCLRESTKSDTTKNVTATKNNGLVDSYFANNDGSNKYIAGTNPALTATTVDKDGWDEARIALGRPQTLSMGEVVAADTNKLNINFSAQKIGNAGGVAGVRLVDHTGAVLTSRTEGNKLEWSADMNYATWPQSPMVSKVTGSVIVDGVAVDTVSEIRALLSSYTGKAVFYLKESTTSNTAKNVVATKGNGLIDSYYAMNNGNNAYLKYVNPALAASGTAADGWDEIVVEILDPMPTVYATEAAIDESGKMTVNFDAAKIGNSGGTAYIRIVDANGATAVKSGVTLQWSATMGYPSWPNTPMSVSVSSTLTVDGKAINTPAAIRELAAGMDGCKAVFVLRESTINDTGKNVTAIKSNGLIDSYYAINDGNNKYTYRINPAVTANGTDADGWDTITLELLGPARTLEVTEVEQIGDNGAEIRFSSAKVGNAGGAPYVRLVDKDGNLLSSATEGTALEWKASIGYITWPNAPMTLTVNNSLIVDGDAVSTIAQIMALKEKYADSRVVFYIIEGTSANIDKNVTPVKGNGLIDSYYAINNGENKYIPRDNPALTANGMDENGWDTLTMEILPPAPTFELQGVSANNGGLTIAFSADQVGNAGAYATLGIAGTELSWELEMGYTTWPNSPMKATPKGITMAEILAMTDQGGKHEGKELIFTLKESTRSDTGKNVTATKGNGLIDSYYAINDGNNKYTYLVNPSLTATGQASDGWDTVEATVTVNRTTTFNVKNIKLVSDTRLLITFDEPIEMLGNLWMGLRVVDESNTLMYYNEGQSPLQWYGRSSAQGYPFEWANKEHTQVYWTFRAVNTMNLSDIGQVLRAEGALGEVMQDGWKVVFCIEEKATDDCTITAGNGLIDTVVSKTTGSVLAPNRIKAGWNDGIYLPVKGDAPTDTLEVLSAQVISDTRIVVTFSAPVEMEVSPYGAIRLVNENNALQYRENEDGTKTPIQWGGDFEYYNKEKTQLVWQIYGNQRKFGDLNNIPDILAFKGLPEEWKDYTFKFCIEEKGSAALSADNHINNITLASDNRVHLLGNKPNMSGYDGHYMEIADQLPGSSLIASAQVLNDRQVLLSFSAPIAIMGDPWFGIRLCRDGKLAWSGEENKSTALQWKGEWEWANTAHTQILWTIKGSSTYGIYNVYDILTYGGGLAPFKDTTTVNWCIEEKKTDAFQNLISYNQRIDNIATLDGTRHLTGNYCSGYDGLFIRLSEQELHKDLLQVKSVTATDDMTLEVVFTEPVQIAQGDAAPTMAIRYLTESGDTHSLADGRLAAFVGTWEWKDETHDTILWTLNTDKARGAENLTDIFTFAGNFKYSAGAQIVFCVYQTEDNAVSTWSMRIDGVTDLSGKRSLAATRLGEICMSQTRIDIAYELPISTETEPEVDPTVYVTDYTPAMILAGVLAAAGLVLCIVLAVKRKEEDR